MKFSHFFICTFFFLLPGWLSAQTTLQRDGLAGRVLLGGALQLRQTYQSGNQASPDERREARLTPRVGYFLSDQLAVGVEGGYVNQSFRPGGRDAGRQNDLQYTVGIFARAYQFVGAQVALFGELGGSVGVGTMRFPGQPQQPSQRYQQLNAQLVPGVAYFVSDRIGLEITLTGLRYGYRQFYGDVETAPSPRSQFELGADLLAPTLGVHLYL